MFILPALRFVFFFQPGPLGLMRRPIGIQEVAGSILGSGTIFHRDLVMK